ncbi:MAG: FecR domain-containing protein [Bacteroidota bacterium]
MDEITFKALLDKYQNGTCTPGETALLESWYTTRASQDRLPPPGQQELSQYQQLIWQDITEKTGVNAPQPVIASTRKLWPRIAAAAAILLIIGSGGYYFLHQNNNNQLAQNQPEQIAPQQNGITLALANGKKISIDPNHKGKLKTDDGAEASQQGKALDYRQQQTQNQQQTQEPVMQTLANNSGSKFSLTLADGTEAILDAHSSISYPTAFNQKERRITITGQAYFKVKHNEKQPFYVTAKNETVEDIGTEFNVDAYEDEAAIKTTLVQGSVRINQKLILKPGEQAVYNNDQLTTKTADLEATLSWLQGKLIFNHEPLESILKRVARVYDVTFIFADESLKTKKFNGQVSQTRKLATVLNFFRKTGEVDFLAEGKTVKVFKKKK